MSDSMTIELDDFDRGVLVNGLAAYMMHMQSDRQELGVDNFAPEIEPAIISLMMRLSKPVMVDLSEEIIEH